MATAYLGFQVVKKVNASGVMTFDVYGEVQGLFTTYQVHLGSFLSQNEAEAQIANATAGVGTINYDANGQKIQAAPQAVVSSASPVAVPGAQPHE